MTSHAWVRSSLLALLLAGGSAASAQEAAAPRYSADDLAAILKPRELTRSLLAGEGPAPGEPGSGVVPDLSILFPFNSAELTPDARAQLDELGQALQREDMRDFGFLIGGHTDVIGSDSFNDDLSRRRAAAVASYLSDSFGIERRRLEAVGYGERELADPANPTSGQNRRVEIRTGAP